MATCLLLLGVGSTVGDVVSVARAQPGRYFGPAAGRTTSPTFRRQDKIVGTIFFDWYDETIRYTEPSWNKAYRPHVDKVSVETGIVFDYLTHHPDNMSPRPLPSPNRYRERPPATTNRPPALSYRDPMWHRKEVDNMAKAGLDLMLIVYSHNGQGDYETNQSNLALDQLDAGMTLLQNSAPGRRLPSVGLFVGTQYLKGEDLSASRGQQRFYEIIRDFYSRIPPERWARLDSKAIVFLYDVSPLAKVSRKAFDYAQQSFARDFNGAKLLFVANPSWSERGAPVDLTYSFGASRQPNGFTNRDVMSISPGYNYLGNEASPRRNGDFYRAAWNAALQSGKNFAVCETWNELHEGTEICPTYEYGDQYVRLTSDFVRRFKASR